MYIYIYIYMYIYIYIVYIERAFYNPWFYSARFTGI